MAKDALAQQKQRFGNQNASHLVVLVHGLWGQPVHMHTIAEQLEEKHGDSVRILIPSTNKFYNTYDGIEVGGERVAAEIEAELSSARASGHAITHFSIAGYSLGGLIARYCIGLLYARGHFEPGRAHTIIPVNFATFASPWLGVPSPNRVFGINLWNFFGSRVLSTSGQQMFVADRFRAMGGPLLVIMADPSSIFVKALAAFRHRVLYSNIVNDRSVVFNTSCIVAQDPFADIEHRDFDFVPGYAPTILDINQPVTSRPVQKDLSSQLWETAYKWVTRLPLVALLVILFPLTSTFFFANAGLQTVRSGARIRSHQGAASFEDYRVPLLLEQAIEAVTGEEGTAGRNDEEEERIRANRMAVIKASGLVCDTKPLNLMPEQYEMIRNLNTVDIKKYPVHIQLVTHAHAAIIVRWKKDGFKEGYTVIKHWLDEEFDV